MLYQRPKYSKDLTESEPIPNYVHPTRMDKHGATSGGGNKYSLFRLYCLFAVGKIKVSRCVQRGCDSPAGVAISTFFLGFFPILSNHSNQDYGEAQNTWIRCFFSKFKIHSIRVGIIFSNY